MKKFTIFFVFSLAVILVSCQKEDKNVAYKYESLDLPAEPLNYANQEISNFGSWRFDGLSSLVRDEVATLGRVLFYDEILSINNSISCGSCHEQQRAFSEPTAVSTGFDGSKGSRNASTIVNLIDQSSFFWDGRESDLTTMVTKPLTNHIEMGLDKLSDLEIELAETKHYPELFTDAFGDGNITKERIANALEQFLSSMISEKSKFDRVFLNGEEQFTALEQAGSDLFFSRAQCSQCHAYFNDFKGWSQGQFIDFSSGEVAADIGLDAVYMDKGFGERAPEMDGMFKIPTLRNIMLTPPYMHDGRFATIDEVLDHYSEGIQDSPNLHWSLQDGVGGAIKLNLTTSERAALKAFLNTLTDEAFIQDEKFSNPFRR